MARGGYAKVLKHSNVTESDIKAIFSKKKPLCPNQLKAILHALDLFLGEESEEEMVFEYALNQSI